MSLTVSDPMTRVVNNDDAAPDSFNTTNAMDVGDSFSGTLDYVGDTDWIAIDLSAGDTVLITHVGLLGFGGLEDPLLRLMDTDGIEAMYNDDAYTDTLNSEIEFTITQSGTYYIVADSYDAAYAGDYVISTSYVTPTEPDSFDPLKSIDWGTQVDFSGSSINVYFAPDGYRADGVTSEGWTLYELQQFQLALDYISSIIDVTFNIVTAARNADFVLIADANGEISGDGTLGYFYPPGEDSAGIGVFAVDSWDRSGAVGDLEEGGFSYVTIVHEVLHGMGLAHPHDDGGASTIMQGVTSAFGEAGDYDLNQGLYTTMTYNSGFLTGDVGTLPNSSDNTYGYEVGPMALDIAVLQEKYGANTTTAAGNDIYDLPERNTSGAYWKSIWDTAGNDTIRYQGSSDVVIDLRAATLLSEYGGGGFVSAANGIAGGFTIANGVVIEAATGGSGNDDIIGNDAANTLLGNAGADSIDGGIGDDSIQGGNGNDDLRGARGDDVIYGGNDSDTLRGGTGNDDLFGGNGNDSIVGQRHGDTLTGGAGDDTLKGGGGSDSHYGEEGDDFLKGGTYNDLLEGGLDDDKLTGNRGADTLNGGAGKDRLIGGGDDDRLIGGTGDDAMKGGSGADVFVFDTGHDSDSIDDFSITDDTLEISLALAGGLTAAQIAGAASVTAQGVEIDFGAGDMILLEGLTTTTGLAAAIDIA